MKLKFEAAGLLASGSSFSRSLPAVAVGRIAQSAGRRRLQWRGPRRYFTGFPFTVRAGWERTGADLTPLPRT